MRRIVSTTDYHTAGEPFRIVTAGVPAPIGATVAQRRWWAIDHLDDVRAMLCREPRGHADMYGGFLTPPDDEDGHLGVIFFHNDGFSTACGHGSIALASWAVASGLVPIEDPNTPIEIVIDVPSGRVRAVTKLHDGRPVSVSFRNVPASVHQLDVDIDLVGRSVSADIAYGGAFYACVEAASVGLSVTPDAVSELIDCGRAVKQAINTQLDLQLPDASGDSGLYGTILYERLGPAHQRNITVFADGQVDRSPCGSGTSARLAVLAERGELDVGEVLTHDSVIGTRFLGRVLGRSRATEGTFAWDTEVEGRASLTGHHTFILDDDDEIADGFILR